MLNFIDIKRNDLPYRNGRVNDFKDVQPRPTMDKVKEQASRCMGCGIAFCHSYGCPLGNNIPEFNLAVANGNMQYAYEILRTTSPFPEFTSRICPALCEASCCANLPSEPVAIKQSEFLIIEEAFKQGYVKPFLPISKNGKTVAVIGAGPSGLSAAHYLNAMGYEVTVFEKQVSAGGLLRYGIPDFKLEKHIVQRRIDLMRQAGIVFEFGVEIGKDINANYLERKFDAICLAIGCETPRDLPIKGRDYGNIYFALDFLRSQLKYNSGENNSLQIDAKGKNVLIIGGGDTGSDCMGTAIRQGAKEVVQIEIMPEPPEKRHEATPWPMWEYKKRTSSSHLEGGIRLWSVASEEFVADKNGNVSKLIANKVNWKANAAGMPDSFEKIEGSQFEIKADLVLLSMGFTKVASQKVIDELATKLTPRGAIEINNKNSSSNAKVFACGDAASGASLVVRAIASGRQTAFNIDNYLNKK